MTKKLETLFNLDSKENTLKESTEIEGENDLKEPIIPVIEPEIPQKTLTNLAKIEESLTLVKGLEASDTELNELAELAQESYKDLMSRHRQNEIDKQKAAIAKLSKLNWDISSIDNLI